MSTSFDHRLRFLAGLDCVERVAAGVYRMFLVVAALAIIGVAGFVIVRRPWGDGNQGEWFYFTIAVLLASGWVGGQFFQLRRRQRAWELPISIRARREGDGHAWELRIGSSADSGVEDPGRAGAMQVSVSRGLEIPLGSLARDVLPDARALKRVEAELSAGADLDEACRAVEPQYADWNAMARWAYRKYVTSALEQATDAGRRCARRL